MTPVPDSIRPPLRAGPTLAAGAVCLAAAIYVTLGLGSVGGHAAWEWNWPARLAQGDDALWRGVFFTFRLPRVLGDLLVGAALSTAGLLLQGISRNPLADPYLLGISGGAGLAVVALHSVPAVVAVLGFAAIPAAAFAGALAASVAVLTLGRGAGGRVSTLGLILSGVVINAFTTAAMTFLLVRLDPDRLRITTTWLVGGVGFVEPIQLLTVAPLLAATLVYARRRAHLLNALALGTQGAGDVGVDTKRLLVGTAAAAGLLAALAVSLAGMVGYVGLVVPHLARRLWGADFRRLLPLTALFGALLVLLADTAGRSVFLPEEIPVGVITALVGCPFLLVLLRRTLREKP